MKRARRKRIRFGSKTHFDCMNLIVFLMKKACLMVWRLFSMGLFLFVPGWRNRQTRQTQNLIPARE